MASGQLSTVLRHLRHMLSASPAARESDSQLLYRFVYDHEQAAFTALVDRHGSMVLGLCRRVLQDDHEADDVFQAAFLVLVRKARSLRQYGSLGNWLYTVAYHLALKARAKEGKRRTQERQVAAMPEKAIAGDSPWTELRPILDAELDRLPDKYRAPIVLCYLEGKTNAEAAHELGWPTGTVKIRLARARDLLRERLTRRGLTLSSALLASALAEQAGAAVPATLLESTTQAAAMFAAGNTLAIGAASMRAVGMAQGALRAMRISKLKTLIALFLAIGLAGAGSGVLLSQGPKQDPKNCPVGGTDRDKHPLASPPPITLVVNPKLDADPAPAKPAEPAPAIQGKPVVRQLAQLVTLEIPPNTTLKEALAQITEKTKVPFIIDHKAFEAIGVQKVEEQPVELAKLTNVRLSFALERLLLSIKGDVYNGMFQVRSGQVEITTNYNILAEAGAQAVDHPALRQFDPDNNSPSELWIDPTRKITKLIAVDIEKRSLSDALREIGEEAGFQVFVDPRAAEKAKTPVTLALDRVLFDTAVTLLVEPAELDWVWLDHIVYVTSKENAKARRHRQRAREEERVRMLREANTLKQMVAAAESAKPPQPPQANVDTNKQPLAGVLAGISRDTGIRVVIDPRVAEKAMTPVTATLQNVAPDTAVRLLANMVDLQAVRVDQVFYITSKENAKTLLEPVTAKPK